MPTRAMSDLSLNTPSTAPKGKSKGKKAAPVADSWEDEDVPSDTESPSPLPTTSPLSPSIDPKIDGSGLAAPPPTPSSPSSYGLGTPPWQPIPGAVSGGNSSSSSSGESLEREGKRPEKTDAVARRMIASALGVRAPRPTEEQRAYDRAVREKERKRREEEREAEKRRREEAERAKVAIWED
ncbi:hypothetical protein F4815DRAFT_444656 [Daldinia loculata]|uniref:uncharacterized protein n=1 Tax=Daldinia loculata TaxID=103429 RepID=UPI0020C2B5D3|nr:uncharacterized protein F4817DRAFT_341783 [Daldinia loculata]KAI1646065.1 hypothetical protein F4817DRAFT_341783 [Daldinia loculata]KAI2781109.1 hypothetical protein F4815DRAFT_444656 [Daldinia loculata]